MRDLKKEDLENLNECLKLVIKHNDVTATIPVIEEIQKLAHSLKDENNFFMKDFVEELNKSNRLYIWVNRKYEIIQHEDYKSLQKSLENYIKNEMIKYYSNYLSSHKATQIVLKSLHKICNFYL